MNEETENSLKESIALNEARAEWSGLAVVFGLIIEVIFAFAYRDHRSNLEYWTPVLSDVIVTLGVAGEILFARKASASQEKLRLIADKRIAELNERVAEAEQATAEADVELVRLQLRLAPRALTEEQYKKLLSLKGKVAEVNITSAIDFDSVQYSRGIAYALNGMGIKANLCNPRLGQVWTELYIVIPGPVDDFSKVPLYRAFKDAGISVGCGDRSRVSLGDLALDVPVIMVGEKANRHSAPPYTAYLNPDGTMPSETQTITFTTSE